MAKPVIVVNAADLAINGGRYRLKAGAARQVYGLGAAQVAGDVEAGPAQPVYVVSDAEIAAGFPVRGGDPLFVTDAVGAGRGVKGKAAIPVYVVNDGWPDGGEPQLSGADFREIGLSQTELLTADGLTWAQGSPMLIDQYGVMIALIQWNNSGTNTNSFIVSNDAGATWAFPTHTSMATASGETFITRGAMAYDSINDLVHVLWNAADPGDGVIYRRYSITRNESNAITAFTRVSGVNLQLDYQNTGTMNYQHPVLIFCDDVGAEGGLLAIWGARNSASATGTRSEVRASMRVLSNTTADNTAGNWKAPVSASTSAIGQSPQVPYSAIAAKAAAASLCHPSATRLANGDVFVVYTDGDSTEEIQRVVMVWDNANDDWSNSLSAQVKLTDVVRAGSDSGYSLKREIVTAPHEDADGNVYVAFSTWKGGGVGDTWSFVSVTPGGTVSTITDVYVAATADCGSDIFVTGDLMYDSVTDRIAVLYTDLPDKHIYAALYDGTTEAQAPFVVFEDAPFDIPTVYPLSVSGQILVMGRDFNAAAANNPPTYTPPYDGWFGTINLGSA